MRHGHLITPADATVVTAASIFNNTEVSGGQALPF